jgi:hypothetical protein
VVLGLLGGELPAADELRDERVVVRELLELAVAEDVGARVADVAENDAAVLDQRYRHGRTHSGHVRVAAGTLVDAAVRLLHQGDDPLGAGAVDVVLLQGGRCEARCDLTRARAAHAVRDCEQRRLADVGVLVMPALPAWMRDDCCSRDSHAANWLDRKLSHEMLRISCDKTGQARLRRACPSGWA